MHSGGISPGSQGYVPAGWAPRGAAYVTPRGRDCLQWNVSVGAPCGRRVGQRLGDAAPGVRGLDDVVDDPDLQGPVDAPRLPHLLVDELGAQVLPLLGRSRRE